MFGYHKNLRGKRLGRFLAIETIYNHILLEEDVKSLFEEIIDREKPPVEIRNFAEKIVNSYLHNLKEIDEYVKESVKNWDVDRIFPLDKAIIYAGVAEFLGIPDTPFEVIIDEAVEIAKMFSTQDSYKFVNGVLDGLFRRILKK